jgi:DNA repair protein RecN (Recombination protein N)
MLVHLSITNIVLIERLSLDVSEGLTVMTGETGAGKSILLDALGLVLGSRANFDLIRAGTDKAQVTASFDLPNSHPVRAVLDEADIDASEMIVFRRQLRSDGKSSAHINDQPVSLTLLRQCGDMLVEIQGQFEGRGLLDTDSHLGLIDRAAGHQEDIQTLTAAWSELKQARDARIQATEDLARAREEEDWLRDAVQQLDQLGAEPDEERRLEEERGMHAHAARIADALQQADGLLSGESGAGLQTARALSLLDRQLDVAAESLTPTIEALSRAAAELEEAEAQLRDAGRSLNGNPERLSEIEERLHSLRAQARKHQVTVNDLPELHQSLQNRLAAMDDQSGFLAALAEAETAAYNHYCSFATKVSDARAKSAALIDAAVMSELPPLKLEAAYFKTDLTRLDEAKWGALGWDKCRFEASTNPGMSAGPIDRIASGGELARFLLALKVALSGNEPPKTLIFDEVDSGVGGAVAAAVGARLSRLGEKMQTLVITHSPQVAGKGHVHLRIAKKQAESGIVSYTEPLMRDARVEEIARMISGDVVTSEARAAAINLLGFSS